MSDSTQKPPASGTSACETCPVQGRSQWNKLGLRMDRWDFLLALAGNPNTGKSTVFNALTGLRQHTGNWPGKTVARAEGAMAYANHRYKLVDLPGTYSLLSTSHDEEIARDFILFGQPHVTVVVVDATRLERNLNLVLQILEITDRVVVCVNLMDEARRNGIQVDERQLARDLGVPVVLTAARQQEGIGTLLQAIHEVATGTYPLQGRKQPPDVAGLQPTVAELQTHVERIFPDLPNARWVALRLLDGDARIIQAVQKGELGQIQDTSQEQATLQTSPHSSENEVHDAARDALLEHAQSLRWTLKESFHEELVESLFQEATRLADRCVRRETSGTKPHWDLTLDRIVTSRFWGIPLMVLLFALVFWLTIAGANIPSSWLSFLLVGKLYGFLKSGAAVLGFPWWLSGLLLDGMYLTTAWVISVMLPPMAIFFPLFTLLEDLGYLPRVAFNLDGVFRKSGGHGKQALSMMMGFGCNAAGVIATRIIDSPRERLIAIITNNFALCNGRWPTQILLATLFIGVLAPVGLAGVISALAVLIVAGLGIFLTFLFSWGLSRSVLRGESSSFHLELPPYRPPRIWQTLYTSLIDRTIFVLWRAIIFALPAGAVIWLSANISIGNSSIAGHLVHWMNPVGLFLGLNGVILLAYIIAIPANEIVVPTVLMLTVLLTKLSGVGEGAGVLFEPSTQVDTLRILQAGGWTLLTAINVMLFSLLHNPCSTTIYTIYKETHSIKWTTLATLLPLLFGFLVVFVHTQIWRLVTT